MKLKHGSRGERLIAQLEAHRVNGSSIASLITPLSLETFLSEYFSTKPTVLQRSRPEAFDQLISIAGIDDIILTHCLSSADLALVVGGNKIGEVEYTDSKGRVDVYKVMEFHGDGATIALHGMEAHHPSLAAVCASAEGTFGCVCGVNIYVTPPSSQGFRPHFDLEDVFILQIYGEKRWRIFEEAVRYPTAAHLGGDSDLNGHEPVYDTMLQAGDLIYIPRGFVHEARTSERSTSVHVTLGMMPFTWAELLLESLWSAIYSSPLFREGLPPEIVFGSTNGWAIQEKLRHMALEFANNLDPSSAMKSVKSRFEQRRRPFASPSLSEAERKRLSSLRSNTIKLQAD